MNGISRWQIEIPSYESWFLAMDFDGVFTDNLVSLNSKNDEYVTCSREDGLGLELLRLSNLLGFTQILPFVITRESGGPARARCRKLGIPIFEGVRDKESFLRNRISAETNFRTFDLSTSIYLGNDVNDIGAMKASKYSCVPLDAHPLVKQSATYVSQAKMGGKGFIREIIDLILEPHMSFLIVELTK
jgi:YrbI family 3-deoxy-D-manno-octulosonate 8-phosphate phosphatase